MVYGSDENNPGWPQTALILADWGNNGSGGKHSHLAGGSNPPWVCGSHTQGGEALSKTPSLLHPDKLVASLHGSQLPLVGECECECVCEGANEKASIVQRFG